MIRELAHGWATIAGRCILTDGQHRHCGRLNGVHGKVWQWQAISRRCGLPCDQIDQARLRCVVRATWRRDDCHRPAGRWGEALGRALLCSNPRVGAEAVSVEGLLRRRERSVMSLRHRNKERRAFDGAQKHAVWVSP